MSKDRLQEFKKSIKWSDVLYTEVPQQDNDVVESKVEQSTIVPLDNPIVQSEFLKEISGIRLEIEHIEEWIREVEQLHKRLQEPFPDSSLGQILEEKKSQIINASDRIGQTLKDLERRQQQIDPKSISQAQRRIQESQMFVTTRLFRDTMSHFHQENLRYREHCKNAIKRELELAGSRKTDDELEDIIDNGVPGKYYVSLLVDVDRARQSLDVIEARHEDIIKLEKSLQELNRIFRDMALLVTDQGAMIDSIEYNVRTASDFVVATNRDIKIAEETKKKIIKKKVCLIFIIAATIAGLLLVLFLFAIVGRFVIG